MILINGLKFKQYVSLRKRKFLNDNPMLISSLIPKTYLCLQLLTGHEDQRFRIQKIH